MIIDAVYQVTHWWFYPGETLIVAVVLAFVPYLVIRGPVGRAVRWWRSSTVPMTESGQDRWACRNGIAPSAPASYARTGNGKRTRRVGAVRQAVEDNMTTTTMIERMTAALLVTAATACSGQQAPAPPEPMVPAAATSPAAEEPIPDTASPFDALPEAVQLALDQPFTDDFDALVKRRAIRVAVTFNRTHYFIDKGQERGLTYESLKLFENDLNADLKTGNLKVHVVIVPLPRNQLYAALVSGKVDMVAAMVTVTPEREKLVTFSDPTRTNVSEVVVTGPGAPPITTADDLAGQEVFVRKGSIYDESLARLSADLKARGKPPVVITVAPDVLEDDDVLEMVNAGLAPITIVDDYLAEFWSQVFTDLTVHREVSVRSGGSLAVAFRKENPRLREVVNTWLKKHGQGRRVPERRRTALSAERQVREERGGRRRAAEAAGGRRTVQEVRGPVQG